MKDTQKIEACASLLAEHRQMEKRLSTLQEHVEALPDERNLAKPQWQAIDAIMADIAREMDIHFACEEKALFPAVEPYHPMVLMEVEHEELMAIRNHILQFLAQDSLDSKDVEALKGLTMQLAEEMYNHISREDAGIFPTCEQALSYNEKQQVIAGMDQIREKAQTGSIPCFFRPERTFSVFQTDLESPLTGPIETRLLTEHAASKIKQLNIKAGESLAAHWSPRQLTLICLSGESTFLANTQQIPLQRGSIVLLDPQLHHAIEAKTDCCFLMLTQTS
ncbi:MAG: hemerythrin domain-containing protein [Cyanobacteria bacterium HKST-UBA03]|nr:hemerythrin domain-containing protein [Cyanobacteria bacterium HKST-UBA03]